jgi:transcriptional regulator with XRE-family HTH domain
MSAITPIYRSLRPTGLRAPQNGLGRAFRVGGFVGISQIGMVVGRHRAIFKSALFITDPNTKLMRKNTLGEFIRQRRDALEMSQRELANLLKLKASSHICDVENGYRQLGEEHLQALADALQVSLEEIQAHDPRAPLSEARELLEQKPEYIHALNRVMRRAPFISPEELIRRVEQPTNTENPS